VQNFYFNGARKTEKNENSFFAFSTYACALKFHHRLSRPLKNRNKSDFKKTLK
jgi:hypothetical protein